MKVLLVLCFIALGSAVGLIVFNTAILIVDGRTIESQKVTINQLKEAIAYQRQNCEKP